MSYEIECKTCGARWNNPQLQHLCGMGQMQALKGPCRVDTKTNEDFRDSLTFNRDLAEMQKERIKELEAKLAESESQAAAMREALTLCDVLLRDDKICDPEVLSEKEWSAWQSAKQALSSTAGADLLKRLRDMESVIAVYEEALEKMENQYVLDSEPPAGRRHYYARDALAKAAEIRRKE